MYVYYVCMLIRVDRIDKSTNIFYQRYIIV